MESKKNAYKLLYFRRQFLLAKKIIPELLNWQHQQIGDMHLFAHPDLEITAKEGPAALLVLLGYIFDPFNPEKQNSDIVADICSKVGQLADLIAAIKPYAGRYALIFHDQTHCVILHDPYGTREIYYCAQPNSVICGSQPNLISKYSNPKLEITSDQEILYFYNHDMKPIRHGRLWIGEETPFKDIRHLRPNHYLDIRSLTAKRYWPNKKLTKMDLSTSVQLSCAYLRGALKAVTARHKTMMAVTSGYDSRSLLAASREVHDQIYYFINKGPHLTDDSPDILIPNEMFNTLKIPFHIHDVSGPVDERFKEIFHNNTFWAFDLQLPAIYNVYFKTHQDKMNILGLGELGRVYYGRAPRTLDGYYLARSLMYRSSYYATLQCEKWLREGKQIAEIFDIDIMKLFLWEELMGNWGVFGNSDSDIAIEEFDPYSSHYMGEILISFDQTQGDLFKEMYKEMWPELLDFPLNPPAKPADRAKHWLTQIGFFVPLRRQRYRFDRWRYRRQWSTPHKQKS